MQAGVVMGIALPGPQLVERLQGVVVVAASGALAAATVRRAGGAHRGPPPRSGAR